MNADFFAFGEILWDCLPSGRHAGGAPFNVAAHLAHLGAAAFLLSAIGQDSLGEGLLNLAQQEGVDTRFVQWARPGLPTGTVQVTLDKNANAAYEIVQPAAWDEISVSADALASAAKAQAIIFGSLASRSPHNFRELNRLLDVQGPQKFFDVNLRDPFVDPDTILHLAGRADIIKLNEDEIGKLAGWVKSPGRTPVALSGDDALAANCALLAQATHTARICVTRAAQGAALWDDGNFITAPSSPVVVEDTVGAGDAFMAVLVIGLTHAAPPQKVLAAACRLGSYVASQRGATPPLPSELIREISGLV